MQYTPPEPATPEALSPQSDPRRFLAHFPQARRGPIANRFHSAAREGIPHATGLLLAVRQICERRQDPDALQVVGALRADPAGALKYTQHVLDHERMPSEQRQHVKAERSIHYRTQAMRGKPPTAPQLSYLHSLGYRGAPPPTGPRRLS